jgi:hypothetical protein
MKITTGNTHKAKVALEKAFELADSLPSKFKNMSQERVLAELHKTREKIWKQKIASGSRH